MSSLITSDIHMTENPRDVYRWGLWGWLRDKVEELKIDNVIVLGDLTDAKDRHTGSLLNKMADGVRGVAERTAVWILKANHDYRDPRYPSFKFLSDMSAVRFFCEPEEVPLAVGGPMERCLFLPNETDPQQAWKTLPDFNEYKYIFCHQTFRRARRENGTLSDTGLPVSFFAGFQGGVYSGDIHVPQRFKTSYGPEYVGAPYRIDFGDTFTPRVLYIDSAGRKRNLRFPCPSKHVVEVSSDGEFIGSENVRRGDQVKVRVTLAREDCPRWPEIRSRVRATAEAAGWSLFGPELRLEASGEASQAPAASECSSPVDRVREFAVSRGVEGDVLDIGISLVDLVK